MKTALVSLAIVAALIVGLAQAQQPAPAPPPPAAQPQRPPFETTKVEGTDNVYVFRYGNHQSMFVVTRTARS